jgi:hypothetical protein
VNTIGVKNVKDDYIGRTLEKHFKGEKCAKILVGISEGNM